MPLDILEKPGTRFMIKIFTLKEMMMMMTTMERTRVEIFYHKPRAGFSRISMGMITRLNEKKVNMISYSHLTLSLRRPLSVDWFLYDNGLRHERVKKIENISCEEISNNCNLLFPKFYLKSKFIKLDAEFI